MVIKELGTSYETQTAVVCRHNGDIVATGMGTAVMVACDFGEAEDGGFLRDIRIDEVLIPVEDVRFPFWNRLVGKTLDPDTLTQK